jgi:hypothetical protein
MSILTRLTIASVAIVASVLSTNALAAVGRTTGTFAVSPREAHNILLRFGRPLAFEEFNRIYPSSMTVNRPTESWVQAI